MDGDNVINGKRITQPQTTYRHDYQPPAYRIERTDLVFALDEDHTLVTATLQIHYNDDGSVNLTTHSTYPALVLNGVDLELLEIRQDEHVLDESDYRQTTETLTLSIDRPAFTLVIKNRIKPQANTCLEGLYQSNGLFCTQCEAEGFRRITYYLDRPDVLSVFTTQLIADKHRYPVLLANGNAIGRGELPDGRHWVTWHDPFKKPCYLFALVAGALQRVDDRFTTMSGRTVALTLFTEPHNINQCDHALQSLKKAMGWDETVYGREYDLDHFMIVAVDHFNMGAMENKGLNIFNTACVLASPETATDSRYQQIEGVVAHEYFHNWSGNRVTCRDWFQLSLKEGFTVFRDSEFSADMNDRGVKRIDDVTLLRTVQFAEDAGPLAHPVQPDAYIEIANFYTATVYEKGAEIVRMLHTILGPERFRQGSDLYFQRHDGQAVTCDDFIQAMADASGVDLQQFRRWYHQAGTPVLRVHDHYDSQRQQYTLTIEQSCPPTPGQPTKAPLHIPVRMGLLGADGRALTLQQANQNRGTECVLHVKQAQETFHFDHIPCQPVPSLLRGFSAPVKVDYGYTRADLIFLMRHDSDSFNRWDASQRLVLAVLNDHIAALADERVIALDPQLIATFGTLLADDALDLAVKAELLTLPTEAAIAEQAAVIRPMAIYQARQHLKQAIAAAHAPLLLQTWQALSPAKPYRPQATDIAERRLKNTCLAYLTALDQRDYLEHAVEQYQHANNMTDRLAALTSAVNAACHDRPCIDGLLQDLLTRYRADTNVMDQWLAVQAGSPMLGSLDHVQLLVRHPVFAATSPNKLRALIGSFTRNLRRFHEGAGAGYRFLADWVIDLDKKNPQIAARLMQPLTQWRRYEAAYQVPMQQTLVSLQNVPQWSKDVYEVVNKSVC